MYRYRNVLVGLSLTDRDKNVLRYAGLVCRMAGSERVKFAHLFRAPMTHGEYFPDAMPDLPVSVGEMEQDLRSSVHRWFRGPRGIDVTCTVEDGNPLYELLNKARSQDIDLLVVGQDRRGSSMAEKLARKAPCSVLIVPPDTEPAIGRILAPVDFSDRSADALDVAVAFADAAGGAAIRCLNVYGAPSGYYKSGKTLEEISELLRQGAEARFKTFAAGIDFRGLTPTFESVMADDISGAIVEDAGRTNADLIAVGTRGRSDSAAVLLGSVAEEVIRSAQAPVVAVKRKGATLRLLEALLEV